jgi:hypothetical protein
MDITGKTIFWNISTFALSNRSTYGMAIDISHHVKDK